MTQAKLQPGAGVTQKLAAVNYLALIDKSRRAQHRLQFDEFLSKKLAAVLARSFLEFSLLRVCCW